MAGSTKYISNTRHQWPWWIESTLQAHLPLNFKLSIWWGQKSRHSWSDLWFQLELPSWYNFHSIKNDSWVSPQFTIKMVLDLILRSSPQADILFLISFKRERVEWWREKECVNISIDLLKLRVSNGWVWGGHNWVGYIKSIFPLKLI